MMLLNHTSRYHVAVHAVKGAALRNPRVAIDLHEVVSEMLHQAEKDKEYVLRHGADREGTFDVPTFE